MVKNIQHTLEVVGKKVTQLWVIVTSVIGSLLVVGVVALVVGLSQVGSGGVESSFSTEEIKSGESDQIIAVVDVSGVIMEDNSEGDPFAVSSGFTSSRRFIKLLRHLSETDEVKGIVMRINSPGGTVVASDEIYSTVREVNAKKPIISSLGDVAASGGYYIAAAGSSIVANPATITGSIGVIAQFPQLSGLYDKLGVEMRTFKSGDFKDIGSADRDMSAKEREIIQSLIDDSYQQFVTAVVEGRKMDRETVLRLADGRIYSGKQAKDQGLVDVLGNLDTALSEAQSAANIENPQIIHYSSQGFFESLFSAVSQAGPLSGLKSLEKNIPSQRFGLYYLLDI